MASAYNLTMDCKDIHRLFIETAISITTITKWAKGGPVNAGNSYALAAACKKLRIKAPKPLQPAVGK